MAARHIRKERKTSEATALYSHEDAARWLRSWAKSASCLRPHANSLVRNSHHQLVEIRKYIEQTSLRPHADWLTHPRVCGTACRASHSGSGREPKRGTHVAGTPYIIAYRVYRGRLCILAVLHAAQNSLKSSPLHDVWPPDFKLFGMIQTPRVKPTRGTPAPGIS